MDGTQSPDGERFLRTATELMAMDATETILKLTKKTVWISLAVGFRMF